MEHLKTFENMNQSENFIEWLNNQPNQDEILDTLQLEGNKIGTNIYNFYGDKLSGIKIDINDLKGYGTQCGNVNNKCFDIDVVDFLKNCGINYIISSIFLHEPTQLGHCLIKFENFNDASTFSEMIEKNNGSLYSEDYQINNYYFFETE